jgi:hypothetical protein
MSQIQIGSKALCSSARYAMIAYIGEKDSASRKGDSQRYLGRGVREQGEATRGP